MKGPTMLPFKRVLTAAGAAAIVASVTGCGGLGVDLRSGSSGANTVSQVAVTAESGVTLNPYPVEIGHTTTLVAHPSSGNVINYAVSQAVVWNTPQPSGVVLLEGNCQTPYGGESTTSICVFAKSKSVNNVNAVASDGAVGTLAVSVVI
jgi:hypothetical protein